ncbi:MAG: cytochrome c biogenesis heme-transporting ATPase CcmA [Methylococcaceae bacterium]|nr:cytochrome c biogenesis heme-transporting ATPase CcmA [Methylococcaceae bacterium]
MFTVKNLSCERDDRVLFSQLHFTVQAGEILQIEGQNGSGKTSLLRILCGLSSSFEGNISWRGQDTQAHHAAYCQQLLYVGHHAGVKAALTAEENLRWMQTLQPLLNKGSLTDALRQVGLMGYEDVPCYTLSAGQQRRVSLARLYLSSHPLWILDEPFTALDKKGVVEKEQLIVRHVRNGGGCILTTHHDFDLPDVTIRRLNLDQLSAA